MLKTNIKSEVGRLRTVLIHEPGSEVENMTPNTAEHALYSDLLNLPIAQQEYALFKGVLEKVADVISVKDLLLKTIQIPEAREEIIANIVKISQMPELVLDLKGLSADDLVSTIIEGVSLPQVSLTNFLQSDKFAVDPLHNMFFMRDASFTIGENIFLGSMARSVRKPEVKLLEVMYKYALGKNGQVVYVNETDDKRLTIEGGDVLVATPEVLIIGVGARTTPEAIDQLVKKVSAYQDLKYVLVQELPREPESFIHLDMVFTLLSQDECMVYEPVIFEKNNYNSILMKIEGGKIKEINYIKDLIDGLKICGLDYKPVFCGDGDKVFQEREQWHSGANFFAFAPGKVMGYARNVHTTIALNKAGYEVIPAEDIVSGKTDLFGVTGKCIVTIESSELARGGGGARCMTMPISRE